MSPIVQLACKRSNINMFQKPVPERLRHLEKRSDYRMCQLFMNQLRTRHSERSKDTVQTLITHPPPPPLPPFRVFRYFRVLREKLGTLMPVERCSAGHWYAQP